MVFVGNYLKGFPSNLESIFPTPGFSYRGEDVGTWLYYFIRYIL